MENKRFLNRLSHADWPKYAKTFLVAAFAVFIIGMMTVYRKPAFRGRVLDAETGDPLRGAAVVVIYQKYPIAGHLITRMMAGMLGGVPGVTGVRETLTDKNGEFRIPPYITMINPFTRGEDARVVIFKPGYGSFPNHQTSPSPRIIHDEESFFSENFGKEGYLKKWSKTEKVIFGVVRLPKVKTWEERRNARWISIDFPKSGWPLLHEMIEKEDEWLYPENERR